VSLLEEAGRSLHQSVILLVLLAAVVATRSPVMAQTSSRGPSDEGASTGTSGETSVNRGPSDGREVEEFLDRVLAWQLEDYQEHR
jgi:hypothetical protein